MTYITAPALLTVVLGLSNAAPATASPDDVVRDCADDGYVETNRHSRKDLREGRKRIPADLDAYSDCKAQISQALDRKRARASAAGSGFGGGDGTPGGGSTGGTGSDSGAGGQGSEANGATPQGRQGDAAESARRREMARADTESLLGDRKTGPGTAAGAFQGAEGANGISPALLLAIIAVGLGLAAGAVAALRRRNPELYAGTLGRLPFPRGLGSLSPFRRRR